MAVQKHNTYYDNELYYYDENGVRKPLQVGKIYSAGSGIKIENDVISVSGKYVASASTALDGKRLVLVNNEWTELIIPSGSDWSQTIQEASAYAYNAATAWTDTQGYLTAHQIIPSAKWENASDIVETNSAKWNDGYNTLSSNSGNLVKKEELYSTSSTLNTNKLDISSFDEYKDLVNEGLEKKQDKSAMSAYAFSSWVDENYQKKGNYLSANALDLISDTSGKWNEVSSKLDKNDFTDWSANYDEYVKSIENDVGNLKSNSSNWDSVYNNVNTNSAKWDAASDEVTSHSANWNSVYESVHTNSGDWEEITKVKTFKTIGGIEAKTSADSLEFSAGENIEIGINEGKIFISSHDTTYDENDFISASHLDNIVSVSATVKTNSADWTSAARALEASAYKWNTTHEQVNTSSVKWNELYDEYQVSSKLWNDTTDVVNEFSGKWNDVSSKADKLDFENLSGKVETLSGELKTTSSFLSGSIEDVSAEFEKVVYTSATENWDVTPYSAGQNINITDHKISGKDWTDTIEEASANSVTTVENKFNGENGTITAYGTSSFANDKYTAGEGLALNDHQFYVSGKYITSAGDSLSGKMLVLKDNEWLEMPEFGGFATANSGVNHPDVQNPSTKLIYLVKDSNVTGTDKYSEWIYTSAEQTAAWECIGDTSLNLTPYLTKEEAIATYQQKGDYVTSSTSIISANETYGLTNDGDTIKWKKIEASDTTYIAGKNIVISGNNNEISVSGLYNTTLTSTNDSVGISSTTDDNGNIQYDLGVTNPGISGVSGVRAYYDENEDKYIVGLEYNEIGFAKYSTNPNVFSTSAIVTGYNEDLNVNPTKISLSNDKILLKKGFYHIDIQTNFTISNEDNNYYDVIVKSIPIAATITQMIDASYAHNETVDLSFDIKIAVDDTPLEISVDNFKSNETFSITNLNIHEIISMPSQIEGGANNYQAGDGITLTNDTIAAKLGNGLEFNESNAIQVKLGAGLKFDEKQGVQSITIDNNVGEVVEDVNKLQEDLDTKITDNFPPAMITLANLQVAEGTQYAPSNGGMLIGYLFTCPITHKIYTNTNNDYLTKIGVYTKQWAGNNNKVILGIYEYDQDYINPTTHQVGTTRALCDTGIVDLQQGYAEYDIKNLGKETTHEMTPGKFYYATIYLSYLAGDTNGITLFGAPGYNTQVNSLKPGITITNVNKIRASLYEDKSGYSQDINFDQMGFSWQFNSYPPDETTEYTSQDIIEANAAGRPYFAIRNIKVGK